MFALVLWTSDHPRITSVIPVHHLRRYKSGATVAKWGSRRYRVRVLTTDRSCEYLESCEVLTDGIVIPPNETKASIANNPRRATQSLKTLQQVELPIATSPLINEEVHHEEVEGIINTSHSDIVTQPSSDKVELIPESDVFIARRKLTKILDKWSDNPRQMSRRLHRAIIGEDTLKTMTPTGRGGFAPIPKNIRDCVEKFVNETVGSVNQLDHGVYMRILTAMCNGLRNPKPYDRIKRASKF